MKNPDPDKVTRIIVVVLLSCSYGRSRVRHESTRGAFAILRSSAVAFASCAAAQNGPDKLSVLPAQSRRIWHQHYIHERPLQH